MLLCSYVKVENKIVTDSLRTCFFQRNNQSVLGLPRLNMAKNIQRILRNIASVTDEVFDNFSEERMRARFEAAATMSVLMWTSPFGLSAAILSHIFNQLFPKGNCMLSPDKRRVVLLTETTFEFRTLHLIRVLGRVGHHIILVSNDETGSSSARYSKYVKKFYLIPRSNAYQYNAVGEREYVRKLLTICKEDDVDWLIPLGELNPDRSSSLTDSAIGQILSSFDPKIKPLSNHKNPQIEQILTNKLFFLTECKALQLQVPDFHLIENTHELKQLQLQGLFSAPVEYYLKPLHHALSTKFYPSFKQNLFELVPKAKKAFESFLRSGLGSDISEGNPHMLCERINGVNVIVDVIVRNGTVVWLDATTISSWNLDQAPIVTWITSFCRNKQLHGFLSFTFTVDVKTEEAFCLDCRPTLSRSIIKKHQPHEVRFFQVTNPCI